MGDLPILLLLLLIVAILLRLDWVYYLVYVLAGVYAVGRWRTNRSLSRLQIKRQYTDHIFLEESIEVQVEIKNTSWWPIPWLRYDETRPLAISPDARGVHQVLSLAPKERARVTYRLVGRRRGYYEIGPAHLSTGDLFGFAEAQGSSTRLDHLTVYPRVVPLTHVALMSRAPHGTVKSQQYIFADPTRTMGVREYKRGDPLRSIDWKSSARMGELQVKKYEPAVSLTSVIFLDLTKNAYSRQWRHNASEWGIVIAASLANHLVGQRQAVGLASTGMDLVTGATGWTIDPRPGRVHLMKLLEWLARVEVTDGPALADWLSGAALSLSWGTTVIAITPTGDEATCAALHRLLRAGLNPVLVAIEPHAQFGKIRQRAHQLGITAHLVANEHDLDAWRVARQTPAAMQVRTMARF